MKASLRKGVEWQLLLLITGGPGTGNFFLAANIIDSAGDAGKTPVGLAYMWSVDFNMVVKFERMTIHKFIAARFDLDATQLLDNEVWGNINVVKARLAGVDILVIDEISTTNCNLFVALDLVLRQAGDASKLFGGLHVILLGDLQGSASLAVALVRASMANVRLVKSVGGSELDKKERKELAAGMLMKHFRRVRLFEQLRARICEVQKAFLQLFDGAKIGSPLTLPILRRINQFTPSLVKADPAFADATVVVMTNMERWAVNNARVTEFGNKLLGSRWRQENCPSVGLSPDIRAAEENACSTDPSALNQ